MKKTGEFKINGLKKTDQLKLYHFDSTNIPLFLKKNPNIELPLKNKNNEIESSALFSNDTMIGFIVFHFLDLQQEHHTESNILRKYPNIIKQKLLSQKEKLMTLSTMALLKDWRKLNTELPLSEILMGFAVLRFMESDAKRLIGDFKDHPSIHSIFKRHGGLPLLSAGEESNFLEITKFTGRLSTLKYCDHETFKLWQNFKINDKKTVDHSVIF